MEKPLDSFLTQEAETAALKKRIAELEAENQRLWAAMRSTGELLGDLLSEDE